MAELHYRKGYSEHLSLDLLELGLLRHCNTMGEGGFDIIIIGAGIAGLAAAIALAEKRNNVTILEAAPKVSVLPALCQTLLANPCQKLAAVGAGIQLPPNSMHVLKSLGVDDEAGFSDLNNQDIPNL